MNKLMYFWEFDASSEQRDALKAELTNLEELNAEMPEGVRIDGVYETFVGHGIGSRFQVMMKADGLSALEGAEGSDGLRKLHQRFSKFGISGVQNRLLKRI